LGLNLISNNEFTGSYVAAVALGYFGSMPTLNLNSLSKNHYQTLRNFENVVPV
jgi:hypothetical protein